MKFKILIFRRLLKISSVVASTFFVGAVVGAATLWVIGLNSGSSGQGRSSAVSNITIAAIAVPSPTNLLFPGGTGDVVATITNPNSAPVTLTAVQLPANTVFGAGFSDSALATAVPACNATLSTVSWAFETGTSGTSHTLIGAGLTVAANSTLTVTFTNDAVMGLTAPAACEALYFSLPSLTNVTATLGAATPTTSPATSGWTS
jgi:hypothetical protein